MFKLEVSLQAEGNKEFMYRLKEDLLRVASQYNCILRAEMTNSGQHFQESISASFTPIIEVPLEDIIDLTRTGEEQYELLLLKEELDLAPSTCNEKER